ncbi:MAG TPA: VOC family protein [Fimbriimonadaceae bacterium]|nr:VOC family protein [Fimbriimonadaceae bacterium]
MVTNIAMALCQVSDMNRAVGFYRDALGMTPGIQSPYWSELTLGDFKIGLHPPFKEGPTEVGRGWILGIAADDLRALRATVESAGGKCGGYHDVPGGCVLDFSDPDQNPIQAFQPGVTSQQLS